MAEAYEASKTLQESSAPTEDEARLAVLGSVYGVLGSVYGLSRQPDRARGVLQQLAEVDRHRHVSRYYFAQVHLALGETRLALDRLEEAAAERNPFIVYVKIALQFNQPACRASLPDLLKRMGLDR